MAVKPKGKSKDLTSVSQRKLLEEAKASFAATDANAPRRPSARYFVSLSMTREVWVNSYIITKVFSPFLLKFLVDSNKARTFAFANEGDLVFVSGF